MTRANTANPSSAHAHAAAPTCSSNNPPKRPPHATAVFHTVTNIACARSVASPAYFAKAGIPETPGELVAHACLMYRFPTTGKLDRWPLFMDGVSVLMELAKSVVTNTLAPQSRLAESGLGLACVPDIAVASQIKAGGLISVLAPYLLDRTKISIMWPTSRHLSPKLSAFVEYAACELLPCHDGSE
ncbi:hypothetical protein E0H22_24295 [Rhodopseudomonas boonkerdii]|uniref:LysR substrate-binding domain-containing protein n=1 Tax=Rhodopseudomonas boonkerdii TaxID=475937 RepID=UPI001E2D47E4|nr:LysR substrate-binding domain-containing protein [Rhodopseudomonas boonkerdii]UGV28504.1 hypothetical protein E0H22_24295 [Rhodopseudomonas boonkerdii]